MTSSGTTIDLSSRKTTFGDGHENNPRLTTDEAAFYTVTNVLGGDDDWDPTPNKKPTITTAADETVTITDAETQSETRVEESTAESETETSTETTVENEKKLPQTGQLWWPVGILLSAGAVLLAAGLVMKKRSKEK